MLRRYSKTIAIVCLVVVIVVSLASVAKSLFRLYSPHSVPARFLDQLTVVPPYSPAPFAGGSSGKAPLVFDLVWQEIRPGETVNAGRLTIHFRTEPAVIEAHTDVNFLWDVTDEHGKPVALDTSVHGVNSHAYFVRDDLYSDLFHIHPIVDPVHPATWKSDPFKLPLGGRWHVVMQFPKDGVLYNLASVVEIQGNTAAALTPDFTRSRELRTWHVGLHVSEPIVYAGKPVTISFSLTPKEGRQLGEEDLTKGHNLIFAHAHDLFVWNAHGDQSVEKVSQKAGMVVRRTEATLQDPFTHTVVFPRSGLWLVHFEVSSEPVRFFLNIEP